MKVVNGIVIEERGGEMDDVIPVILSKYVPTHMVNGDMEYRLHIGRSDGVFDAVIPDGVVPTSGNNEVVVSGSMIDEKDGPYGKYMARMSFRDRNRPNVFFMDRIDIHRPGSVIRMDGVIVLQERTRSLNVRKMEVNGKDVPITENVLFYLKI